ncbi:MAG: hypothetical protein V1645_04495 [archaeon]
MKTITILIVLIVSFSLLAQFSHASDLTRKEAEQLYRKFYVGNKTSSPCYLFLVLGKWNNWGMREEKRVYKKLQEIGLIDLKITESYMDVYETKITEKGKHVMSEVTEEEVKGRNLSSDRKWYKMHILSVKFIGCTGVQNFSQKNEAIADFDYGFEDLSKTLLSISGELKKALGQMIPGEDLMNRGLMYINLRHDWLEKAIENPNFKGRLSHYFDLYDDGWRIRKTK